MWVAMTFLWMSDPFPVDVWVAGVPSRYILLINLLLAGICRFYIFVFNEYVLLLHNA